MHNFLLQSREELKEKSPELAAKLNNLFELVKRQLAELDPEGKEFLKNMTVMWKSKSFDGYAAPTVAEELTLGFIKKFNALSDDVKEDIKKKLPALAAFLTSETQLQNIFSFNRDSSGEETAKRLQEH
ncbi:unnamed protein product [Cylicostephanus goldi]|uniref:Uncharacterized protein n=1 Tax=Cylicostephanus goldi TaxID=71465 RepID=A0A3P7QSA7_CYLGO|nr:unnamed protein product [Cylicostephanus goldi]